MAVAVASAPLRNSRLLNMGEAETYGPGRAPSTDGGGVSQFVLFEIRWT
jgi:hypothetical protein